MIFGRRVTREYKGKLQTVMEDLNLPHPVIRSHYGKGFVKQYVRDDRVLRTEAATNNVTDYGGIKSVDTLPELRGKMAAICDNYHNVQQDIMETFVDRGQLQKLTEPTTLANGKRIPGLKLDHPRQLALMHALVRFAPIAVGGVFTVSFRQACVTKEIRRSGGDIRRLNKVLPVVPGHPAGGRLRQLAWMPQ
jgi:hypothetical protein